MASPMPTPGIFESIFSAPGTAVFVTPLVAYSLGGLFYCTTAACGISTCVIGGFAGGSSAGLATIGTGNVIYKLRYKQWLKENGGKYAVNQLGKLEMIPVAFIATRTITLSPLALILLTNSYCFFIGYISKKEEIKAYLVD